MTDTANTLTIEDCLTRAKWAGSAGYHGKRPDDSTVAPGQAIATMDDRHLLLEAALAYATLAIAMQNERDYEERKIREITEKAADDGGS